MELFKSISKSVLKNFVQLMFLVVLVILSTAAMVAFSETSNSVRQESNSIRSTSKGSDFAINLDRIQVNNQGQLETIRTFLIYESNQPLYAKTVLSYNQNGVDYTFRSINQNTFTITTPTSVRTLSYSDSANFTLGLEQLFPLSVTAIEAIAFQENNQNVNLTEREATVFKSWLTVLFAAASKRNIFLQLDQWATEYGFTYSYLQSLVFTAQRAGGGNTSFIRLFPTIISGEKPYNLNLIKGKYAGTTLSSRFSSYSGYSSLSSPLDFYAFCNSVNTSAGFIEGTECFRELKTQIVLSKNYAQAQGLKIGDIISIGAVDTTVVGIGESRNVEFPSVVPTYLIPFSSQVGVGWIFDNDEADESIYSFSEFGPVSSAFLILNSIFNDNYIYGKFNTDIQTPGNSYLLTDFESVILAQSEAVDGQKYFYKVSDSDYPISTNINTLPNVANSLRTLAYVIVGLVITSMILVSVMATKSMVQEARARLAVMKAIGYKQSYILAMYSVVPLFLCAIATVIGYFVGVELLKILINFVSPFMLNPLSIPPPSVETLAVIILVPFIALGVVTMVTTYLLIKEPPAQSLKLHENKKPSLAFKYAKQITPSSRKSARLSFSLFVSSFGKLIALNILLIISTGSIFAFMAASQVFSDYSVNYKQGKNYQTLYYYNQPTWNLPITQYTRHNRSNPSSLYGIIDLPTVRNSLEGDRTTNGYSIAFNELLKTTWFKDKEISLTTLGALDQLQFPASVNLGGTDFSYELIKNLFCTSLLGYYAPFVDLKDYTITSCLDFLFDQNLPALFKQKIQDDPSYALSIGRIDYNSDQDDLFTWSNARFESRSNSLNGLTTTNTDGATTTRILGLDSGQRYIDLRNSNGENLFSRITDSFSTSDERNYIPIIINRSLANNLNLEEGNYVRFANFNKELVDINNKARETQIQSEIKVLEANPDLTTNQVLQNNLATLRTELQEVSKDLYGVIRDDTGSILETSGEMNGDSPTFPDGEEYRYYDKETADKSNVITIANRGGINQLGWSTPDSYLDRFKENTYQVQNAEVIENYKVVGVTENLDLGQNFAYTLRSYHNQTLKYPSTAFSGKVTTDEDQTTDFAKNLACVTNERGLYAQNSLIPTGEFANPITSCINDVQVVPLVSGALGSLSDIISPLIYVVLGLFSLLTAIVVYIVNDVISKASRKITITLRALGYKTRQIFTKLALIYIPIVSVSITLTLVTCYLLIELVLHDYLKANLFDIPIQYRWWYFVGSGVLIFGLFFIVFIINFFKVRRDLIGKRKRK